ncbi:Scr1 family TA system antitoxin-like transcriptional regulator [Streptomyces sp. NPDC002746]
MADQHAPTGATTSEDPSATSKPWPPRVYDYVTDGDNGFAADREFGLRIMKQVPWVQDSMWINKRYRTTAALVLARELGITQVIDLGCGYPSYWGTTGGSGTKKGREYIPPHTYDVVHAVHGAGARVVYADADGYVFAHAKASLDELRGTSVVQADARDIPALLGRRGVLELIDLDAPVGVILNDVLPWVTDDEAALLLRNLHDLLPAGSAVALTHATADDAPEAVATLVREYAAKGIDYRPRSRAAIGKLLGPWDLLHPGLQPTARWREDQPPHIPRHLRTTLRLPADASHAYAAVTAPKTARPEPPTVNSVLAGEPARTPGPLLVGATLKALREQSGTALAPAAANMSVPPLALALWESGSRRLARRIPYMLEALGLDEYDAQRLLERLLNQDEGMQSSLLPWEREEFGDAYPGNIDRANAVLRAATRVRAFALDRVPEAFQTPAYAGLFPDDHAIGPATGLLPPVTAPCVQEAESSSWVLVLDEGLINRFHGHPQVLAEQLDHLLHLDTLPHVTVRVLRLDTPFAMPVANLTEHTLTGGVLWRLNGFVYRGLSRGDSCRPLLDQALGNAASEPMSRALLEQARDRALNTPAPPTVPVHVQRTSNA